MLWFYFTNLYLLRQEIKLISTKLEICTKTFNKNCWRLQIIMVNCKIMILLICKSLLIRSEIMIWGSICNYSYCSIVRSGKWDILDIFTCCVYLYEISPT